MTAAHSARILVVEDNQANRDLMVETLELFGYAADVAVDGHHALEKVAAQRYELILMDCRMPRLDGFETTRCIRDMEQRSGRPATKVIALTANAMAGDRERCLAAGMDEYMAKPFELEAMRAMIDRLIGSSRPGGA